MNHVSAVPALASIRHCSAAEMNRIMEDPEAVKAFADEPSQAEPAMLVYHPSAALFLERKRNGEPPFVPLSG